MALYEARGERCWQSATNVAAHEIALAKLELAPHIYSKASLFRWSAVVRGAVDTGCRRNNRGRCCWKAAIKV